MHSLLLDRQLQGRAYGPRRAFCLILIDASNSFPGGHISVMGGYESRSEVPYSKQIVFHSLEEIVRKLSRLKGVRWIDPGLYAEMVNTTASEPLLVGRRKYSPVNGFTTRSRMAQPLQFANPGGTWYFGEVR